MENFVLEQIFLEAFNISLTAGWVIAVVLLLRALLKPVPKKYVCLLWFVVLFRLLCPVTLESEFSLVPQHEEVKYEIVYTTPQMETNSDPVNNVLNQTVNPVLEQTSAPNPMGSVNPLQVYIFIAAWIWIIGMVILCGYTLISWIKMRHRLAESIPDGDNVYLSDTITSPFVFGILKPKIYLPYGLEDDERRWVLLHEQSHIARKDYIVKPLFWLAVMIHWMNPLVWIAWFAFSRDLELACDERATASMNGNEKWNYSNTLLALAVEKHRFECPVAFSNNGVRQRIERILKYKQLPKVVIGVVLVLLMVCGVGLMMNPAEVHSLGEFEPELVKEYKNGINGITVKYGALDVSLRVFHNEVELEKLRNQLAELKVEEVKGIIIPPTNTSILISGVMEGFYNAEEGQGGMTMESYHLVCSDDFQYIYGQKTLKVKDKDALKNLILPYCQEAIDSYYDKTAFSADLNHDGVDEKIILNKEKWDVTGEAKFSVYQTDGTMLYDAWLYSSHAGWGNYFLYEKNGKDYLLEFMPTMYQGYADYSWRLLSFDKKGQMVVEDEKRVKFTINPEQFYNYDVDTIHTFLQEIGKILSKATLLISVDDGELRYSTTNEKKQLTISYYLEWLMEVEGNSLEEKLDTYRNKIMYERPEYLLRQWLSEKQSFDATKHYLGEPKLIEIEKDQAISFELKQIADNKLVGIYGISTMDSDNFVDVNAGRNYYRYDMSEGEWILLANSMELKRFEEVANEWATAYAERDGQKRYDLLRYRWQVQIDNQSSAQELWMPYWSEDKKVLDLRGSSPWVNSWTIKSNENPERYLAVITYDMVDSSKEHYIYEEQILIQTIDEELQVTDCDVTISNLTSEQYWQAVNIAADLQNGHETWRLDTEQVANIFMTDYLNLSWDEVVEQRRSYEFNTVDYMMKNGDTYTVQLYQPLIQTDVSGCDFWAVESYTYNEWIGDSSQSYKTYHYDVRHDTWASLHIKE